MNSPQIGWSNFPHVDRTQSRPQPRGGLVAVIWVRLRSTMACKALAVAVSRRVCGKALAQSEKSACKASSSATASDQRWGRVRRSTGLR